ncbi:hypothetical protein M5689_006553 [Euphorbia peplus]|nr:hypothetical protein M5689_006553 [Euphorbia peplus]
MQEDLRLLSKTLCSFMESEKANASAATDDPNAQRVNSLHSVIDALGAQLTSADVIKATRLIGQDPAKVIMFFSMPDDDSKLIFVSQELGHV